MHFLSIYQNAENVKNTNPESNPISAWQIFFLLEADEMVTKKKSVIMNAIVEKNPNTETNI